MMLIVTREEGEGVIIESPTGEALKVSVEKCRGTGRVKLGFDGPESIQVTPTEQANTQIVNVPAPEGEREPSDRRAKWIEAPEGFEVCDACKGTGAIRFVPHAPDLRPRVDECGPCGGRGVVEVEGGGS